jgi:hypothetical protein
MLSPQRGCRNCKGEAEQEGKRVASTRRNGSSMTDYDTSRKENEEKFDQNAYVLVLNQNPSLVEEIL